MATSLVPKIEEIVKEVRVDGDAVRDFAKSRNIYVHIDNIREENDRVASWLINEYGLYSPDVDMINFCNAKNSTCLYNWTLEHFISQEKQKFNCWFKLSVGKKNKVTIAHYDQYKFGRIWNWYFKCEFVESRLKHFATMSKAEFIASDDEIEKINEFNQKYKLDHGN